MLSSLTHLPTLWNKMKCKGQVIKRKHKPCKQKEIAKKATFLESFEVTTQKGWIPRVFPILRGMADKQVSWRLSANAANGTNTSIDWANRVTFGAKRQAGISFCEDAAGCAGVIGATCMWAQSDYWYSHALKLIHYVFNKTIVVSSWISNAQLQWCTLEGRIVMSNIVGCFFTSTSSDIATTFEIARTRVNGGYIHGAYVIYPPPPITASLKHFKKQVSYCVF